jgi:hypothetical protein
LLYWRRLFGDFKRRLAQSKSDDVGRRLFNPVRREVESRSHDEETAPAQVSPEEQARLAALVENIRSSPCEYLSHEGLAAIMPFETRR